MIGGRLTVGAGPRGSVRFGMGQSFGPVAGSTTERTPEFASGNELPRTCHESPVFPPGNFHAVAGTSRFPPLHRLACGRISVHGELDRANVHQFDEAVEVLHRSPADQWWIDASGITFCDVVGLRGLLKAHKVAVQTGRTFVVSRPGRMLTQLLTLVGTQDLQAALAGKPGPPRGHRHTLAPRITSDLASSWLAHQAADRSRHDQDRGGTFT